MQTLTQQLANPTRFMSLSGRLLPWISALACALIAMGLVMAFAAPLDYQQGHAAKIMYVHVPAAWLSMLGYVVVAGSSFGLLVFRHPLADVSAKRFLEHYSRRLNSVEINYTFRRLPSASTLANWIEQTPSGFSFSIKAHERITHFLRLKNAEEFTAAYSGKQWIDKERARLNKAIDDAERGDQK